MKTWFLACLVGDGRGATAPQRLQRADACSVVIVHTLHADPSMRSYQTGLPRASSARRLEAAPSPAKHRNQAVRLPGLAPRTFKKLFQDQSGNAAQEALVTLS